MINILKDGDVIYGKPYVVWWRSDPRSTKVTFSLFSDWMSSMYSVICNLSVYSYVAADNCDKKFWFCNIVQSLVTQPMLQRRPNRTHLRSMDSCIQILCRFQKCKQKVPPPSLLSNEKSPFNFLLTFLEST